MKRMIFALLLSGCMPSGAVFHTPPSRTLEPAGKIDFTISAATISSPRAITLPDHSSFILWSVSYDYDHSVAYLSGRPADSADPTNLWPQTDNCTLSQTLTPAQIRSLQSQFETIHLCRVHAPPGTPVPMMYVWAHGTVSGWGKSFTGPAGYVDNAVDICDFSDLSPVSDAILNTMDLTKPMSCATSSVDEF